MKLINCYTLNTRKLGTCAYMTSDAGNFRTVRLHNGAVKVGGNNLLPAILPLLSSNTSEVVGSTRGAFSSTSVFADDDWFPQ